MKEWIAGRLFDLVLVIRLLCAVVTNANDLEEDDEYYC